jgi:hypothetical protein
VLCEPALELGVLGFELFDPLFVVVEQLPVGAVVELGLAAAGVVAGAAGGVGDGVPY